MKSMASDPSRSNPRIYADRDLPAVNIERKDERRRPRHPQLIAGQGRCVMTSSAG